MALSKAACELEHLVICGICLERFAERDTRVLSCLHRFCRSCLQQTYSTNLAADPSLDGYIVCPTCTMCTEWTRLPSGAGQKRKSYFVAEQDCDVLLKVTKEEDGPKSCPKCMHQCRRCLKGVNAIGYCFDCSQPMCGGCYDRHNEKRGNISHVSIPLTAENIDTLICDEHTEYGEDYCIQCGTITCGTCHQTTHKGHEFRVFCLSGGNKGTQAEKSIADLQEKNQAVLDEARIHHATISKNIQEQEQKIGQRTDVLIQTIRDDVKQLKTELRKPLNEINNIIHKGEQQHQKLITVPPLPGIPQVSLEPIDDDEHIPITIPTISKYTLTTFEADTSSVDGLVGKLTHPVRIATQPPRLRSSLERTSVMSPELQIDSSLDKSSVVSPDTHLVSSLDRTSVVSLELKIATQLPRLISSLDRTNGVFSLDFMLDGNIVTVNNQYRIRLYDQHLQRLEIPFYGQGPGAVTQIAVDQKSGDMIAVGSTKNTLYLTVIRVIEGQWHCRKLETDTVPWVVNLTSDGHILFGERGGYTLVKCDIDGRIIWKRQMPHKFGYISGMADGRFTVTTDDDIIHVYNHSGTELMVIPQPADQDKLSCAEGMCSDSSGNMYICDSERGVVCMFNKEGRFVRDVISGLNVTCDWMFVSLFDDRLLAIGSSSHGGFIKVYAFDEQ